MKCKDIIKRNFTNYILEDASNNTRIIHKILDGELEYTNKILYLEKNNKPINKDFFKFYEKFESNRNQESTQIAIYLQYKDNYMYFTQEHNGLITRNLINETEILRQIKNTLFEEISCFVCLETYDEILSRPKCSLQNTVIVKCIHCDACICKKCEYELYIKNNTTICSICKNDMYIREIEYDSYEII